MRRDLNRLAVVAAVLLPVAAAAIDSPHDASITDGLCSNCHTLYTTTPSGSNDFNQGCVTCHNARPSSTLGFPWLTQDQAVPGQLGNQHSWTGYAANPQVGARMPVNVDVAKRLVDGKLQCEACHDPHKGNAAYAPNSRHTSIPVGTPVDETGGPSAGTARMTLVTPGTSSKAYRVLIQTVTAGGGTFILSHDFGLATPSWFNWSGTAWVVGTSLGAGMPFSNGTPVALDDPAVTVTFTAGAAVGNYWDFYVSYPMLRTTNVSDAFCLSCHASRAMDHVRVAGEDAAYLPNGIRQFSHPVGDALNANGKNYDRAVALDANGAVQTTGDGRASNDLVLDPATGTVGCTTCHAVHNADSNSLTDDAR